MGVPKLTENGWFICFLSKQMIWDTYILGNLYFKVVKDPGPNLFESISFHASQGQANCPLEEGVHGSHLTNKGIWESIITWYVNVCQACAVYSQVLIAGMHMDPAGLPENMIFQQNSRTYFKVRLFGKAHVSRRLVASHP